MSALGSDATAAHHGAGQTSSTNAHADLVEPEGERRAPLFHLQTPLPPTAHISSLATSRSGAIAVAGCSPVPLGIDAVPLAPETSGQAGAFIAGLDDHGQWRYRRFFPGIEPCALALDPLGHALLTGRITGDRALDCQSTSPGGLFVAKLDLYGKPLWVRTFPRARARSSAGRAIAADHAGNVLFAAYYEGEIPVESDAYPYFGEGNVFIAKLDPHGQLVWARDLWGPSPQDLRGLAVDTDGNTVIAGTFSGVIGLGKKLYAEGERDAFIAKMDPAGRFLWARSHGHRGRQAPPQLALARTGAIFITAPLVDRLDLGTGPLETETTGSGRAHYLARLDAAGRARWTRSLALRERAARPLIAATPAGNLLLSGPLALAPRAGATAPRRESFFLAELGECGEPTQTRMFSSGQASVVHGLAVDRAGYPIVAGRLHDTTHHDRLRRTPAGDMFLGRLERSAARRLAQARTGAPFH